MFKASIHFYTDFSLPKTFTKLYQTNSQWNRDTATVLAWALPDTERYLHQEIPYMKLPNVTTCHLAMPQLLLLGTFLKPHCLMKFKEDANTNSLTTPSREGAQSFCSDFKIRSPYPQPKPSSVPFILPLKFPRETQEDSLNFAGP